jgi:hypothetical protein
MSGASVFRREEFLNAKLALGDATIDLADYATTGIRAVVVGPSGIGKTNALAGRWPSSSPSRGGSRC